MKIFIDISPNGKLCGDCDFLYRLTDCHHISAVEEVWCEIFGDLEQENTGLISESIKRHDKCINSELGEFNERYRIASNVRH